jgi:hypothetical protein
MSANNTAMCRQCNVQIPKDLVEELRVEAYRLTGHRRRGFSDLLSIFARYGWEAYQRGDLEIERRPKVVSYNLEFCDTRGSIGPS